MFRRVLGKTLGFVGYTIQYGCIAHCAFEYIGEIVVCSGPSMEPTIVNKDVVFLERMSRHLCKIQKGDIVIAKSLFDPNMNICKRVIGLEGDKVCTSGPSDLFKTHTYVPKGHVWLEGDNLTNSTDSRSYGPVPYALIRGRVCLKGIRVHSHSELLEAQLVILRGREGLFFFLPSSLREVCSRQPWVPVQLLPLSGGGPEGQRQGSV
ncbi:mitochondrial inner membrane protease subunit 1 isoform X1 [Dunckerocampus dactyliophorus]|uniref:mitochondrial inner membrane protease subunit 1 isoform X1 n=1 Tax=Dunckerocampus dactyliophorus TaxID=161453 RepID=UPI002406F622|nr:mitochondrial inner membrane protease subunit 1 isoform X1 [Dunckerocampus dactyliophorus]